MEERSVRIAVLLCVLVLAVGSGAAGAAGPRGGEGPPHTLAPPPFPAGAFTLHPEGDTLGEIVASCVEQDMALHDTPGAAAAVAVDGVLAHEAGFGERRRRSGLAVTPHTVFRIGSITKMMTAAGVLQLAEAGLVDLDAPVTAYLPDFRLAVPGSAATVTLRHLLTHTSDIPDTYAVDNVFLLPSLESWLPAMEAVELHAPAGSFWNYSNPNFSLAGLVIQRVSGMDYPTYMEHSVWGPAGMTSTTLDPHQAMSAGDYSWGHNRVMEGREIVYLPDDYDSPALAPAGMAFSTAGDLVRWALLLMDGGAPVLQEASARAMQAPQVWTHYRWDTWYGFGVFSQVHKGLALRHHGGNVPGWGAFLLWVPDRGFAVSVLANGNDALDAAAFCIAEGVLQPTGTTPDPGLTGPEDWRWNQGRYEVRWYDGTTATAEVRLEGDSLTLTLEGAGDPADPVAVPLTQVYRDTFVADMDGDGTLDTDWTIIAAPGAELPVVWMRNRLRVGTRIPPLRRPAGRLPGAAGPTRAAPAGAGEASGPRAPARRATPGGRVAPRPRPGP